MAFDWDDPLLDWDNGDYWDETNVQPYLDLVTSAHNQKPDFIAFLTAIIQPLADSLETVRTLNTLFDIDTAVGVQLDQIGLWVGRTRNLSEPITGVYFTYNTGPGYNIGIYKGPFDPESGLVALPDPEYRIFLKAVIAANHWNGSVPGAYAAYAILFQGTPFKVLIFDYQDMTMALELIGGVPDALTTALFTGGYLSLKPEGVRIRAYIIPVVAGPVFTYNAPIGDPDRAGYNIGHYAKKIPV